MTISFILQSGSKQLQHLETLDLDVEVLLSHVLNKPREYILAHSEDEVSVEQEQRFNALITDRAQHKPIAYLTRHKEFYGRDFFVDERVHIPRPATEDLIDFIKKNVPSDFSGTMADIGTGSGCIAITLALEFPRAKIIATDISEEALNITKKNALKYLSETNLWLAHKGKGFPLSQPQIRFAIYQGDLLAALPEPVDIIVSNPPYGWLEGWSDDKETLEQPLISYESGIDGLDAIKQIISQLPRYLNKGGQAFIEFDPRQTEKIKKLAAQWGLSCAIIKDASGFDRIARLTN